MRLYLILGRPCIIKRKNHIDHRYHIISEIVVDGIVGVVKITYEDNIADPFTKTPMFKSFEKHVKGIGIQNMTYLLY